MEALGALEQWPVDNAAAGVLTWEEATGRPALIATVGDSVGRSPGVGVQARHILAPTSPRGADAPARCSSGSAGCDCGPSPLPRLGLAPGTGPCWPARATAGSTRTPATSGSADLVAERAEMDFSEYLADASSVRSPWTRRASAGRLARRGLVGTLGDLLAGR